MKKGFPVLFFSLIIALIDLAVILLAKDIALYIPAISLFLTHVIFVFLSAKTGFHGVPIAHALLRSLLFFFLTPYPVSSAVCAIAGGILGEAVLLFTKKKRGFVPSSVIYFLFYLVYAFQGYVHFDPSFGVALHKSALYVYGALLISFVLSFFISRWMLISKMRTAGIEK